MGDRVRNGGSEPEPDVRYIKNRKKRQIYPLYIVVVAVVIVVGCVESS